MLKAKQEEQLDLLRDGLIGEDVKAVTIRQFVNNDLVSKTNIQLLESENLGTGWSKEIGSENINCFIVDVGSDRTSFYQDISVREIEIFKNEKYRGYDIEIKFKNVETHIDIRLR